MSDLDFDLGFGGNDEELDTTGWAKQFCTVSNGGGVSKSLFAETCIELVDAFNVKKPAMAVERAFYSLDKDHNFTFNKFAQRDSKKNIIATQDETKGIALLDIKNKGAFINSLSHPSKLKIADFPSRGVDDLFVNAFNGDVQAFIDVLQANQHVPYFVVPYVTDKCHLTVERIYNLLSSVKTKLPIHIIFFINKGLMKDEEKIMMMYKGDDNVKDCKKNFIVDEVVINAKFDDELVAKLVGSKMIDLLSSNINPFSRANLTNYLMQANKEILPLLLK